MVEYVFLHRLLEVEKEKMDAGNILEYYALYGSAPGREVKHLVLKSRGQGYYYVYSNLLKKYALRSTRPLRMVRAFRRLIVETKSSMGLSPRKPRTPFPKG